MKSLIFIVIAVAAMAITGCHSTKVSNNELNELKEIVELQNKALEKANILLDKHNIYDKDGSDDMADYLEYQSTAYKMYNGEQQ